MSRCAFGSYTRLAFILSLVFAIGGVEGWEFTLPYDGHRFALGPEVMHMNRTKEGGTEQNGWLYGGRAMYERLLSNSFYWALEAEYAGGSMTGHSARGRPLKSDLSDLALEARLGYTFSYWRVAVVPFFGGGYFCEHNRFKPPSPMSLVFRDDFLYATLGFLSRVFVTDEWSVGVDFKARWMWEGEDKVMADPDYPPVTTLIESEIQYLVDVPIIYKFCWNENAFEASLIPFWEHRHFGGREAYPFDFIDTQFDIYGLRVMFTYCL